MIYRTVEQLYCNFVDGKARFGFPLSQLSSRFMLRSAMMIIRELPIADRLGFAKYAVTILQLEAAESRAN